MLLFLIIGASLQDVLLESSQQARILVSFLCEMALNYLINIVHAAVGW